MTHTVSYTVFYSSEVSPPKDKVNGLKTVLEFFSAGSKSCFHLPFPHRITLLFPEKESSKLLSFQTGRKGIWKSLGWLVKVSLYIVLHISGSAITEILLA